MGQRLNIELIDSVEKDNVLANCYYHWSGYTSSALYLSDKVLEVKDALIKKYGLTKKAAIKILEETGATLTVEELEEADKIYPGEFSLDGVIVNRSNGLISITENGIEETRNWEEARVTFYLEDDIIDFRVMWNADKEDVEEDVEDKDKIIEFDFWPYEMTYDQFKDFTTSVLTAIQNGIYYCKMSGEHFGFIE